MKNLLFTSLLLLIFFVIVPGSAQQPAEPGEAVWALDFVKVKPGMFEQTMNYFDYGWIAAREAAKKQGAIVAYRRIAEDPQPNGEWDIILMTEYKNQAAYDEREKAFAPIVLEITRNNRGKMMGLNKQDLYDIIETRVLHDFSETASPHLKLIGKL